MREGAANSSKVASSRLEEVGDGVVTMVMMLP
jgi:hypothetical protein